MANLTVTISEDVLKKARIKALEQGTSVNTIVREYLDAYAGEKAEQTRAVSNLLRLSTESSSRRGSARWTRDSLHERDP